MTAITPTIKLFTSKEDSTSIHINSLILEHNGNNYQFPGATNDTIHVFTESIALYVLTINKALGTMALNCFIVPEPDPINSVHLHNEQHIQRALGHGWNDLSPATIVEKLIDLLI